LNSSSAEGFGSTSCSGDFGFWSHSGDSGFGFGDSGFGSGSIISSGFGLCLFGSKALS
jgi:hypothetical protein